jgi:hypothetical protein
MWSGVGHPGKYSSAPEPEGVLVFQQHLYIDKQAGKTRRSNSILYKEYGNMLFIIIVGRIVTTLS